MTGIRSLFWLYLTLFEWSDVKVLLKIRHSVHVSVFRQSHCLIAVTFAWCPYIFGEILCQHWDLITERAIVYGLDLIKVGFQRDGNGKTANHQSKQSFGFAAHNGESFVDFISSAEQSSRLLLILLSSSLLLARQRLQLTKPTSAHSGVFFSSTAFDTWLFPSLRFSFFFDGARLLGLERFCHFKGSTWVSEVSVVFCCEQVIERSAFLYQWKCSYSGILAFQVMLTNAAGLIQHSVCSLAFS